MRLKAVGDKVRVIAIDRTTDDWTPMARIARRHALGKEGVISHVSDSHGVCYEVFFGDHDDPRYAWFESYELALVE